MTVTTTEGMTLAALYSTDEVTAVTTGLPVGTWAGQNYRTMLRVVVPVAAGDVLDINGWARCTNNVGYTVGIEYGLWQYDADNGQGSSGTWTLTGPQCGDNVDPTRHHMPLAIADVYPIPPDWPEGHRIVIVLRADAASTAAQSGDKVTVDPLGTLTVRRWTLP